jgi:hypothetical protein
MPKKAREVPPTLRTLDSHLRDMERTLRQLGQRHSLWTAFASFLELSAITLSNVFDLNHKAEREERYLRLIKQFTPEEAHQLASLLGMTTLAMECGFADVLGKLFTRLELQNVRAGQVFTPYEIAQTIARMTLHDCKELLAERGFLRVCEPAVGAGSLVIAVAEAIQEADFNYQQAMHVIATDVDVHAVHMAYIQFSLLHIPAIVIHGDSLSLEEWSRWATPVHFMGAWHFRLKRLDDESSPPVPEIASANGAVSPAATVSAEGVPALPTVERPAPVFPTPVPGTQLTLF